MRSSPAARRQDPNPSRYRWTILAVGVAAQAAFSAMTMGLPALGPALRDAFGLSLAQVGLVLASANWGSVVTLIAWGALADRIGERTVIAAGLGSGAVALWAASLTDGFAGLLIALAVAGGLAASAASASGRAVMGWFGRSERGFALGVRQMAVPLGGALGALSLPLAARAGGLDAALLVLAAGCAAGALAAAVWVREAPAAPHGPGAAATERPPPLRDARVWRLAAGSGLIVCGQTALLAFVVLFLHDERGVSPALAAAALAAIQVGGGLARLVAGRWSDRRGRRVAPLRRLAALTVAGLLAVAALAQAPLVVLGPVLLACGIVSMSWNGLSLTATAELAGRARAGTAMGLQGTIMRLPATAVGVAFGALVASTSWAFAFAALAALPLAGWALLAPLAPEEERRLAAREAVRAKVPASSPHERPVTA